MATMTGVGLNDAQNGQQCGQEATRAALADLELRMNRQVQPGEITLALLFTSHPRPEQILKGVYQVLPDVSLIGATSAGEYSAAGYVEQGAGVMLVISDNIQFHPMGYQKRWFGGNKLLGELRGLSDAGLGSVFNHRALMLFPDNSSMALDHMVDRAVMETGMLYDILGGPGPALKKPPRPSAVFHNQKIVKNGLVAAELLSQQAFGLALANGWAPVGGPYRVTKADKNRVQRIDGRSPVEVYEDFLEEQNIPFTELEDVLMQYPIGICKEGICKVSMVMGLDNSGALQVTSPPSAGSLIHILMAQPAQMVAAAEAAIREARAHVPGEIAGMLFIDCMSTQMLLGEVHAQQRQAVQESAGDVPFLGYRSHGVLSRLQGQLTGHYECSVATYILPG